MRRTPPAKRLRRTARTLPDCLRQFLTPAAWKQARRGQAAARRAPRWGVHHLTSVLITMTWCLGDSSAERFEMARGIVAICRPERRRAGRTAQGFQKALARLPMRPLTAPADAVRRRIATALADDLSLDGFIPLGCDGSRLECPRTDELLRRMGVAGKPESAPALWVTALVHLTTGVPWAWRLGRGDACERDHLRRLIPTLPATAPVVADAGFHGYDLAAALLAAERAFLIRMSSSVRLFVDRPVDPARFTQGEVTYWPTEARQKRLAPLRLRLIRVRGRRRGGRRRGADVTSVLEPRRLSAERAARFYRLRWENEGLFRSYKRAPAKVHLVGRTVRAVHREAYGSLLGCQVLLAQGAWASGQRRRGPAATIPPCSARQLVREVRRDLAARLARAPRAGFRDRLERCARERRPRAVAKQKRAWPQRTPHIPPKPPRLLTMNDKEKALYSKLMPAA